MKSIAKGEIVLIYDSDGREEETDMCCASEKVIPDHIRTFRKDGGGLICTTVSHIDAERLGLPFMTDIHEVAKGHFPLLEKLDPNDIPYDSKSSFSLTINHRNTRTGIPDNDRAMTIVKLAGVLNLKDENLRDAMGKNFRSPGHVHLLRSARGLLKSRQGHTELATALVKMAGVVPSATICEMMGDDGEAMKRTDAMDYAEKNGFIFLDGSQIMEAFSQ